MAAARALESAPLSRAAAIRIPRRRRSAKLQWVCQCENTRFALSARAHAGISQRGVTRFARRPTQLSRGWSVARGARCPDAAAARGLSTAISRLVRRCQPRHRVIRRGFFMRVMQEELRGSLACAQHHVVSLGSTTGQPGRRCVPRSSQVSRGGVARLVQPTGSGEGTRASVATANSRNNAHWLEAAAT